LASDVPFISSFRSTALRSVRITSLKLSRWRRIIKILIGETGVSPLVRRSEEVWKEEEIDDV